jgi:ubiquinone/menaquinone biosynthesis C-methylase UbiE
MPKPELIARQSAHPRGFLGHIVARVMALDTAKVNRQMLERLEPKPGERILELGCGHGRALRPVAERVAPGGVAVGIDPSEVMCGVARHHARRALAAGHARVAAGYSDHLPEPDASFDKAFSVHTLYFWPDLARGLRELRRVLKENGELWLAFHSSDNEEIAAELPPSVYTLRSRDEVRVALSDAGFRDAGVTVDAATHVAFAHARA